MAEPPSSPSLIVARTCDRHSAGPTPSGRWGSPLLPLVAGTRVYLRTPKRVSQEGPLPPRTQDLSDDPTARFPDYLGAVVVQCRPVHQQSPDLFRRGVPVLADTDFGVQIVTYIVCRLRIIYELPHLFPISVGIRVLPTSTTGLNHQSTGTSQGESLSTTRVPVISTET